MNISPDHISLPQHSGHREQGVAATLSQVFSDLFNPLLIPTYAMLLATNATILQRVPISTRLTATAVVGILTGLMPFVLISILLHMGVVSNRSISNRHERKLPFLTAMCGYIAAAIYLRAVHACFWLICFFFAAAVAILVCSAITRYWKISAHTTAAGGLAALMLWLGLYRQLIVFPVWIISFGFLITGILGSSRLILGRHTLGQVAAGALLGFATVFATLEIFC